MLGCGPRGTQRADVDAAQDEEPAQQQPDAKRVMAKHAIHTLANTRELTKNEVRKRRLNTKAIMRAERYA